ncbi:autotransporter outer membrane beta-barrel domain-containing protein [Pseudomonas sp. NA-150]|uniref:autotransporter outer membrane beta-barrel domain-containing protein n=1 Tax=Pseudomonas sp. NA-150 TaxID=3367525 RepID=UPI0037C88024
MVSPTPYDWLLHSASLTVTSTGVTKDIDARDGSTVTIEGGRVNSDGQAGIRLTASDAIINNATIIATNVGTSNTEQSFGLNLMAAPGGQASTAQVKDSTISGVGRGINLAGGSTLTMSGTHVKGNAGIDAVGPIEGGVGLTMFSSTANLLQRSVVTGDNLGAIIAAVGPNTASTLNIDGGSQVIGLNGSAIKVSSTNGTVTDATINITNGSTLTGGNGVILDVEQNSTAHFNVNNSRLVGDVMVESGSTANLDLQNNASLTGKITNASSLNIDGSSLWVMEGDSSVGKLGLNGGTVDLRGTTPGFHQLAVGELSGNGTFALGTDLAAEAGDTLNVKGQATGTHKLLVENSGISPLAGGADRQLVHIGSGDAQFSVIGGKVDVGTFAYELEQQDRGAAGIDWALVQTSELSKSAEAAVGLFSAAPTVWYGESATLRSRMGELRNGQDQGGGWMRTYGNKFNMSAAGGTEYKQTQQGISFGADLPVSNSDGQWLLGLMGGYSKSDLDLKGGTTGTVHSTYIGAYSTWVADDGFYIDALIKANRFQNQANVTMRDGEKAKGKYNNYGIGGSIEAGKHITFADDWFVEPYAQVSTLWVSGNDYTLDNGLEASSNKADSLLGKVGTHLGRKFALEDGGFVQPYVKAAVGREFVKNNKVSVNDQRFTNDLSGSRAELGAGISAQLTDVMQVHADFDYMNGRNIEQPWGVNVGLRYNW